MRKAGMAASVSFLVRVFAAAVLTLATSTWGEAAGRLFPVTSSTDLQNQVKATASKVIPAVVSIASTVMVRDQAFSDETLPFGLFREPPARRQYGQGSGVIVSSDGYIITNNHVVADAVDVEVILADRRQFKGKVVATDPKTDVAVVKIQTTNLPTVSWGDSSNLAVGDFVLAIGNPLGLSRTVTFGIVSAVGRADVGVADFEDFIQTDAPINPGNSGGALVNTNGELVGINTAIASPTGGSVGVGFAIPSNMARAAMQSLIKTGRVVRGFLGASTQDVTPLLGKIFRLPDVKGAIVTDLQAKGSAEKAGLKRGDVIERFDGRDVMDSGHLRNLIAAAAIGSKHRLDLVREGKMIQVDLTVQEAPRERAKKSASGGRNHLRRPSPVRRRIRRCDASLGQANGLTGQQRGGRDRYRRRQFRGILWSAAWRRHLGIKPSADSEFFHVSAPRRPHEIQRSRTAPRQPSRDRSLHPRSGGIARPPPRLQN